ncbi:MAG: beta-phosphoglucomutase [Cyclobacteriaceae bacterium]|nr:beta-phosphoglucomutase [Cyclobacteriaceae bacterium]
MIACIFDLDGVLVDTAQYHFLAWKKLAAELGIDLTLQNNERLKGVGRMDSLNIILSINGISLPEEEKERLATKKNTWFTGYIDAMKKEEILPGAVALLDALQQSGIKIALASSSKNAQTVIDKLDIRKYFDAIVDGNMISRSKPDPEIFITAAMQLNVSPVDCIVIEDAEAGVEAAKAAGMKCVGIGSAATLSKADCVVDGIGMLNIDILNKL